MCSGVKLYIFCGIEVCLFVLFLLCTLTFPTTSSPFACFFKHLRMEEQSETRGQSLMQNRWNKEVDLWVKGSDYKHFQNSQSTGNVVKTAPVMQGTVETPDICEQKLRPPPYSVTSELHDKQPKMRQNSALDL